MLSEITFLSLGVILNNIPADRQYPMTWLGTEVASKSQLIVLHVLSVLWHASVVGGTISPVHILIIL